MRFSLASTLVVTLAATATANSWFGSAGAYIYDKWHETELERWLSDHSIPHPSPSDRKNLQSTVKAHWNDKVVTPYTSWDAQTLTNYLTLKGQQAKKGSEKDVKSLAEQVKVYWTETEDSANQAYGSVKEWIFDSWSDSQLKAFADKHGIPVPQPRQRDSLIKAVRENYQSLAEKAQETVNYPSEWLWATWSESELKAFLDERGYPVPQPSTRDSLIAQVRRQSRLASLNAKGAYAQVSSSAAAAQQSLTDALIESWGESELKNFLDKNNVKVPQGSKKNELIALARKHRARLAGDNVSASATSAYGAASTKAGNEYAKATAGLWYYVDIAKSQLGFAADAASTSASSLSGRASASATSLSGAAAKAASSSSSSLPKSAASASSVAAKSASSAASVASKSAASGYDAAGSSASSAASSASKKAKDEL